MSVRSDARERAGESETGMQTGWMTDWTPSARWPHYTRSNAGEVLPTPVSPLGQTFTWEHGICRGWADGYVRTGYFTADEFDEEHPGVCGFFGGFFYINLSNVRMQGVRSPGLTVEQLDLAIFGDHPDVPAYRAHPDDERPELVPGIVEHMGWVMSTTTWPEIDNEKVATRALRADRPDLAGLSDVELVAMARATQPMLRKLFDSHTVSSSSSAIGPGILHAIGQAIGDPTIPMKLVAGIGEVDSAEPSFAMWEMSRVVRGSEELTAAFDAGVGRLLDRLRESDGADAVAFLDRLDAFLAEFGSRGPNEWEISADTWETRPEIALAAIDRVRLQVDAESPHRRQAEHAATRERVTAEVRALVLSLGDELAGQFEAAIAASHQLAFRERTKTNIIRAVHEGRMAFRELGRRRAAVGDLAAPAHVFMLLDDELDEFIADPTGWRTTLADRHLRWTALAELEPPYFIKDGVVPRLADYPRKGAGDVPAMAVGDVLHGVPGCAGTYRGRARVVTDAGDPGDLQPGDVLVAPLTDPAWTPLFMAAGAVVVDVGGQISHAIIVSRELGLPCVVSATDATRRIPNGALIDVDGDLGTVTLIQGVQP
ncbi:MAG: PEP-utilizing enzyme [Ilumatobacteraceae bacterium]